MRQCRLISKYHTKTVPSFHTLPLVAPFQDILMRTKAEQSTTRKLCCNCYYQDCWDYVYVNELGKLMKPGYLRAKFPEMAEKNRLPRISFQIYYMFLLAQFAQDIYDIRLKLPIYHFPTVFRGEYDMMTSPYGMCAVLTMFFSVLITSFDSMWPLDLYHPIIGGYFSCTIVFIPPVEPGVHLT